MDFNDVLLRSERSAVITGNKEFLNNVNVTIELDDISEFVTVNSDQRLSRKYINQICARDICSVRLVFRFF